MVCSFLRGTTQEGNFTWELRLLNPQRLFGVIGGVIITLMNSRKIKWWGVIQEVRMVLSATWPAQVLCVFFWPDFWVEFGEVNFGSWISRGWIFQGASLLLEKQDQKNRPKEFGSKIRVSKICCPEFGPKFGFRRRKIPCADFCPWVIVNVTKLILRTPQICNCTLWQTIATSTTPWKKGRAKSATNIHTLGNLAKLDTWPNLLCQAG